MNRPKLRKKDFVIGGVARVVITENWVSNGHWAVRKALVANGDIFASEATAAAALGIEPVEVSTQKDDSLLKMEDKASKGHREIIRTTEVRAELDLDPKRDKVIFRNGDTGAPVAFQRTYVTLFDVQSLKGTDERSPWVTEEGLILMSMRTE